MTNKAITFVLIVAMVMPMIFDSLAVSVYANQGNVVYPNSATLESLLNERSFVVDALKVKARKEDDYSGDGFQNNPHFRNAGITHYLYEEVLNDYESNIALKSIVDLYWGKNKLENYPLETLCAINSGISPFNQFLKSVRLPDDKYKEASELILKSYLELGGELPTQTTYNRVKQLISSEQGWEDYSAEELTDLIEGTEGYESYKARLRDSDDERDQKVLTILEEEERKSYNLAIPVVETITDVVENLSGLSYSDGATTTRAKIYDVILNNMIKAEYTSSFGISLSKDFETKTELDECTQILKNEKNYLGYMGDLVDLTENNAEKILVEDYLQLLMNANEQRGTNVLFALGIEGDSNFPADIFLENAGWVTEDYVVQHYGTPDDLYKAEKQYFEEKYLVHEKTADFISTIKKGMDISIDTLSNYYLIDALVRENEYIRGVLDRSTSSETGAADSAWNETANKYRKLLDVADESFEAQAFISVLKTASSQADKIIESSVSKLIKQTVGKTLISTGKNAATRASIARGLASLSVVYTAVDMLDDHVAGFEDAAEHIFEIKYLLDVQDHIYGAYLKDVEKYKAATDPAKKDEYAADALADLQFLKQIKLRQTDDAYNTLVGLRDGNLSGWIAKIFSEAGGEDGLRQNYIKEKDALINMMVCPVGGTPITIDGNVSVVYAGNESVEPYYKATYTDSEGNKQSISEFDLLCAGGVVVNGTLELNCDMRVPQISGNGTIIVKDGFDPVIGYVNGNLRGQGNVHIRGSVIGSVVPVDTDSTIEIDGSFETNSLSIDLNSTDNKRGKLIIHRDLKLEYYLGLRNVDCTVDGKCYISTITPELDPSDIDDGHNFMHLDSSSLTTKGEFAYYGCNQEYHWNSYFTLKPLENGSELIIYGTAKFPLTDNDNTDTSTQTFSADSTSSIVVKGDGTAELIGYYRNICKSDGTIRDTYSTLYFNSHTLRFDTDRIKSLQNVEFGSSFEFPEKLTVTEDSKLGDMYKTDVKDLSFEKNVEIPKNAVIHPINSNSVMHIGGDLNILGSISQYSLEDAGTIVTDGNVYTHDNVSTSYHGEIGGDMIVAANATATELFASIGGNLIVEEDGEVWDCVSTIHGDLFFHGHCSTDGQFGSSGKMDNYILYGNADIDVQPDDTNKKGLMTQLTLMGGTVSSPQVIHVSKRTYLNDLSFENAVASFPDGLKFVSMGAPHSGSSRETAGELDKTLTITGKLPYFKGRRQTSGTVIFEEDVDEFYLGILDGISENNLSGNLINNIYAKKDITLASDIFLRHASLTYEGFGQLKVDGKLIVPDGRILDIYKKGSTYIQNGETIVIPTQETDIGGTIRTEGTGKVEISTDILNVTGLEEAGVSGTGNGLHIGAKTMNWAGGDIVYNGNREIYGSCVLDSNDTAKIKTSENGSLDIENLIIKNGSLDVEGNVTVQSLSSSKESVTITGDMEHLNLTVKQDEAGNPSKVSFRNARNLERLVRTSKEFGVWDVSTVTKDGDTYVVDADLIEKDAVDNKMLVTYYAKQADKIKVYTWYYIPGKRFLPAVYVDDNNIAHSETEVFLDREGNEPYDLLSQVPDKSLAVYCRYNDNGLQEFDRYYYYDEDPFNPGCHHLWDYDYIIQPTCETDGVYGAKCQICGEISSTSVVAARGHNWSEWEVTKPATEDEEGVEARVCSRCKKEESRAIPKLQHTHSLVETPAKAATRTETGNTEYWTCSKCGKFFSDAEGKNEIAENSWIIPITEPSEVENAIAAAESKAAEAADMAAEASNKAETSVDESDASEAEEVAVQAVQLALVAEEAAAAALEQAQNDLDNLPADATDEQRKLAEDSVATAAKYLAEAKQIKAEANSAVAGAAKAAAKIASNKAAEASEAAKAESDPFAAEQLRQEAATQAAKAAEKASAATAASDEAAKAAVEIEELAMSVTDPAAQEEINKAIESASEAAASASNEAAAAMEAQASANESSASADESVTDRIGTPEIQLSKEAFTYKYKVKTVKKKKKAVATVQKPTVTVTINGKTVSADNYDVTYSNAKSAAIGQYTVTVTLKGQYSGSATATYTINPKAVKLKKVVKGKKSFTASWAKLSKNDIKFKAIDGYQIRYATKSDFSDAKTISAGTRTAVKKVVKKLKGKKKYYVQLRTYKKVKGVTGGKLFSAWSVKKSVTTKK